MKNKLLEEPVSTNHEANGHIPNGHIPNGHIPNGHVVTGTTPTSTNHTLGKPGVPNNLSNGYANGHLPNGQIPNGHVPNDTELEDLEAEPIIETISQKVSNGVAHSLANGVQKLANGHAMVAVANGSVANGHAPLYSEHI